MYYRARYYDPTIGKFISRDPAGMPDGPNRYAYVQANEMLGVAVIGEVLVCLECRAVLLIRWPQEQASWFHGIAVTEQSAAPAGTARCLGRLAERRADREVEDEIKIINRNFKSK